VFQTNQSPYPWQVVNFIPPALNETQADLMVYELLLRDFTDSSAITTAIDKLDYLKNLGINAIELMPVNEFDGNESWGYAPNFFFAPDKYYGRKSDYKKFIDECHKRGMAVILDIVMNHCFGQCPLAAMYFDASTGSGQPSPQNPWLNPQSPHPLSVGYDFNHESPHTRDYFKQVLGYWLKEYKVDGYRFDLSKGLTQKYTGSDLSAWSQYDQARINILTDYYNHIKSVNSRAYVILEHFANNDEEKVLANSGMMLWGAMHDKYKQVGMGWQSNSDFSWAYFANRGWNYPNVMDYMENHDQERVMFEALANGNASGGYNIKDTTTALNHMELTAAMMLGVPGPKMVWQFEELGYDYSINFNGDRTARKPPRWDYFNQTGRQRLYHVYSAMAKLRKRDAFRSGTFSGDLGGPGKRMWINHSSMNTVIAGNMNVTSITMSPGFSQSGAWYDYFSGETVNITDPANQTFTFAPGEFRVFTSIALPKPYHEVTVVVKDSASGAVITGAEISFPGAGVMRSDASGKAIFIVFPGTAQIKATKTGYKPYSKTFDIFASGEIVLLLQKGASGLPESDDPSLRVYPNPCSDAVFLYSEKSYAVTLFSPQGIKIGFYKMDGEFQKIDLAGLPSGIYFLRFEGCDRIFTRKLIINSDL
jgi:glycosidase